MPRAAAADSMPRTAATNRQRPPGTPPTGTGACLRSSAAAFFTQRASMTSWCSQSSLRRSLPPVTLLLRGRSIRTKPHSPLAPPLLTAARRPFLGGALDSEQGAASLSPPTLASRLSPLASLASLASRLSPVSSLYLSLSLSLPPFLPPLPQLSLPLPRSCNLPSLVCLIFLSLLPR